MRLTEGMAAGNQCHGLFVAHGHASESSANVMRRRDRVGLAVRAFRVDVNQAHLHGGQRVFKVAGLARFAVVVGSDNAVAFNAGRAL